MLSASLYNYASITCSVCVLIRHLKSMTRTYQASQRSESGSLAVELLFRKDFEGSAHSTSELVL